MEVQKPLVASSLVPPVVFQPQRVDQLAPHQAAARSLPAMRFVDQPVNAKEHVAQGTSLFVFLGYFVAVATAIVIALSTFGVGLIALIVGPIVAYFRAKRTRALIRGSGIALSAEQLPEMYAIVEQFSRRLGLAEVPETFIIEDALANGFAVKIGKRNTILLTDEAVWGALHARDPRTVGFVIGHELGHIALGHTGSFRSFLRSVFRPLSRADEFSADNIARALVGEDHLAISGLTVLTVGPQLLPYINEAALIRQAQEVCANKLSKKVEKNQTHPLLLRRIGNVMS